MRRAMFPRFLQTSERPRDLTCTHAARFTTSVHPRVVALATLSSSYSLATHTHTHTRGGEAKREYMRRNMQYSFEVGSIITAAARRPTDCQQYQPNVDTLCPCNSIHPHTLSLSLTAPMCHCTTTRPFGNSWQCTAASVTSSRSEKHPPGAQRETKGSKTLLQYVPPTQNSSFSPSCLKQSHEPWHQPP